MRADEVDRLGRITALKLDLRLGALRRAAADCARVRADLVRLDALVAVETADPSAQIAAERHEDWRKGQRARLNRELALAMAHWLETRAEATRAFGEAEAFRRLADRLPMRRGGGHRP